MSARVVVVVASTLVLFTAASASAEPYPQEVRDAFMQSCTGNGGPEAVCRCTLDEMEKTIPLAQLEAQDLPEDQITAFVEKCVAIHLGSGGETGSVAPVGTPSTRICDHLAKHAVDYEESDAADCATELQELLSTTIAAERHEALVACVLFKQPITQEQFGECLDAVKSAD